MKIAYISGWKAILTHFFMLKLKSENHSEQSALRVPLVENNEWGQLTDPITMVCYINILYMVSIFVSHNKLDLCVQQSSLSKLWMNIINRLFIHSVISRGKGIIQLEQPWLPHFPFIYLFNFFLKILYFSFYYF